MNWLEKLIESADSVYDKVGEATAIPLPKPVAEWFKDDEGTAPTHFSPIAVDFYREVPDREANGE